MLTQSFSQANESKNEGAFDEYRGKLLSALNKAAIVFSQNAASFDDVMTDGLNIIADAVDLGRVTVWHRIFESGMVYGRQVFRWEKDSGGSTTSFLGLQNVNYTEFAPEWEEIISAGESMNGPVDRLPGGWFLKKFGAVSAFITPIFENGNLWGVVIFDNNHKEIVFSANETDIMQSAAYLCVNTIVREELRLESGTTTSSGGMILPYKGILLAAPKGAWFRKQISVTCRP